MAVDVSSVEHSRVCRLGRVISIKKKVGHVIGGKQILAIS